MGLTAGLSARDKAIASISTGTLFTAKARCRALTCEPGDLRITAICDQGILFFKCALRNWCAM